MLSNFKDMVSDLYWKWKGRLMQSLNPMETAYFESICFQTAAKAKFSRSLYNLTHFIARKFGRKVIVLIDEYDSPNNSAYERGYFNEVRSLCLSL